MANRRSGSDEVRKGVFDRITSEFDYQRVNGLTETPPITQNPTRKTSEPYIYVYSVDSNEIDATKTSTAREYGIYVDICTRYNSYGGGQRQVNRMVDEVVRALRNGGYPDITSVGYSIYNLTIGEIRDFTFKERGANYYKAIIEVFVTADYIELPTEVNPVQSPTFQYSTWMFTPVNNNIERYDTGVITPGTTYPSGNNGWNFVDASYSVASNAVGTFTSGNYNVLSGGTPIALSSSLRYEFADDTTETTTLTGTTSWNLIDSIRFGAIDPVVNGVIPTFTDDTAVGYGLRNLSNWHIEYGTVTPHNETVEITGTTNQYIYIIVDSGVTLTQIVNNVGQNAISLFNVQTVGDYKIYVNEQPIVFNDFSTEFTLVA